MYYVEKAMYYVAKTYEHVSPSIVEEFQSYEDAAIYVALMHKNGKGKYIILNVCGESMLSTETVKQLDCRCID